MIGEITSVDKIRIAAHLAVLSGHDEDACTYPQGSAEREIWMSTFRKSKFEEECA